MAILINALNTLPALQPEPTPFFALPKNHLDWVGGDDVKYDLILFRTPITYRCLFQCREVEPTLDTNLKYATPSKTYGSYEYFANRYFVSSGFFIKDWMMIEGNISNRISPPNYIVPILSGNEVRIELENQNYIVPPFEWLASNEPFPEPLFIRYSYISYRIKMMPGAQIRLVAALA